MPSLSIKINPVKRERDEYYCVVPEEALPGVLHGHPY